MKKVYIIIFKDCGIIYSDIEKHVKTCDKLSKFLQEDDLIVTPNIGILISRMHEEKLDVSKYNILDFECFDKQMSQVGKDGSRNFEKWKVWDMVCAWVPDESLELPTSESFFGNEDIPVERIMSILVDCFMRMKCHDVLEWQRIEEIELKVNKLLYSAQSEGMIVPFKNELEEECKKVAKDYYKALNQLQLQFGIDTLNVIPILRRHNKEYVDPDHLPSLELLQNKIEELVPYIIAKKNERKLNVLIKLTESQRDHTIHPVYKPFASISSRIMLRNPAIQYTPRELRNVLFLDKKVDNYLYIDYSQFEVSIFCGMFDSEKLGDLYVKGEDVYSLLARSIYNLGPKSKVSEEQRDNAKVLFYCFLYGYPIFINDQLELFFKDKFDFQKLNSRIEEFKNQGYVSSPFGNKRKIVDKEKVSWLLNHWIQSTASLIFKQALINVYDDESLKGKIRLLVPMHDAALYYVVKSQEKDGIKNRIIEHFETAFARWIENKNIKARCEEKDYFGYSES